jgi:hypothetical protein
MDTNQQRLILRLEDLQQEYLVAIQPLLDIKLRTVNLSLPTIVVTSPNYPGFKLQYTPKEEAILAAVEVQLKDLEETYKKKAEELRESYGL